ncbi:MAG TPA: hypothetical protein VG815_21620 [Chloroflexota bacterium]|nr:hypothetical protein [Chloroflexota bacterium]
MWVPGYTPCGSGVFQGMTVLGLGDQKIRSTFVEQNSPLQEKEQFWGLDADKFVAEAMKQPATYVVPKLHIMSYSERIVQIARMIKERRYDIVIAPLRGAALAGRQLEPMCAPYAVESIDAGDMGRGLNHDRIARDLQDAICDKPKRNERRLIGVVDTAVGGHSCLALTEILRSLQSKANDPWYVGFHLLHAASRTPNVNSVRSLPKSEWFEVEVRLHPVEDLIAEDKNAFLGSELVREPGWSRVVQYRTDGTIVVYESGVRAVVYQEAALDDVLVALVARENIEEINTLQLTPIDLTGLSREDEENLLK